MSNKCRTVVGRVRKCFIHFIDNIRVFKKKNSTKTIQINEQKVEDNKACSDNEKYKKTETVIKKSIKRCEHKSCIKKRQRNKCNLQTNTLMRYFRLLCPCFCCCNKKIKTPVCCEHCPYKKYKNEQKPQHCIKQNPVENDKQKKANKKIPKFTCLKSTPCLIKEPAKKTKTSSTKHKPKKVVKHKTNNSWSNKSVIIKSTPCYRVPKD